MKICMPIAILLISCVAAAQPATPKAEDDSMPGGKVAPASPKEGDRKTAGFKIPGDDKEAMGERDLFAWLVRKPRLADGSQGFHGFRSEWKNKPVQVEGFFWYGKVVFEGGEIVCKSPNQPIAEKGTLVRITGVLKFEHGSWSRFGSTPPYFYIEVSKCEAISVVDDPHLVGLSAEESSGTR